MSSRDKMKGNTMVLPNIPKMTDDKNRIKYMTDYEKYEPELLKHHLGPVDTTTTIGLKNVAADFDRTVPSADDPTVAEVEYEKYMALRNARRKKKGFSAGSPTKSKPKPAAPPLPTATPPVATSNAAPPSPSTTPTRKPTPERMDATIASAEEGANVPFPPLADGSASSPSAEAGKVVVHTPSSSSTHPQRSRQQSKVGADGQISGRASVSGKPTFQPAPPKPAAPLADKPAASSRSRGSIFVDRSPLKSSVTSEKKTSPRRPPPPRKPLTEVRPPPSARSMEAFLTADDLKTKSTMDAEDVQKYLTDNCPRQAPVVGTSVQPADLGSEVAECADILRVLVNPPPEYSASVKLDIRGMEIDWIAGKRRQPPNLTTLQNWQSMTASNGVPKITSPRSVLVLLRNGVSTRDLRHLREEDDTILPQDPILRTAVKRFRVEREKSKREELCEMLLNDYLSVCAQFSLQELLFAVNRAPNVAEKNTKTPTSLLERQEKQRKQFEINKVRLVRTNELAESLLAKKIAAEDRRLKAEDEQRDLADAKRRQQEEAKRLQQQRLAEQKAKIEEMERVTVENLKARQMKAEKRNEERIEAQERQFQQQQQLRRDKEAERKRRFAHAAMLQEQQAEEVQRKREAVEQKLEEIEESKRLKALEDHRLLIEKQARVREARKEAALRALEQEEQIKQVAIAKQQQVDERIQKFIETREEEAQRRVVVEQQKAAKRQEAFQHAVEIQEVFQQNIAAKRKKHDQVFDAIVEEKNLSLTLQREVHREEMAGKASSICMLQRVEEFKKLRTVAQLIEKKLVADHLKEQREAILAQSLAERDKLASEKEALRRKLETTKV